LDNVRKNIEQADAASHKQIAYGTTAKTPIVEIISGYTNTKRPG